MRFHADVSACSGNEWVGSRKMGIGGEVDKNDRSAICGGLSSMHDNPLLSVQFFSDAESGRISVSKTGLRCAICPRSSTAQDLPLQRSARNLQDRLSSKSMFCQLHWS